MKIVSLNVGLPREVQWHGQTVTTGIFKSPTAARIRLRKLNLDGDRQADLTVHGGEHKAVYCYPVEHYSYWKKKLPGRELPLGSFGENLTTEGMLENDVHIGDRFAINDAEVVVTQPRLPCYKLGMRFQADDMVKKFLASRRSVSTSPLRGKAKSRPATKSFPVTQNAAACRSLISCDYSSQSDSRALTRPPFDNLRAAVGAGRLEILLPRSLASCRRLVRCASVAYCAATTGKSMKLAAPCAW